MKATRLLAFAAILLVLFAFDLPDGWFKAGNAPSRYDMGVDKNVGRNGSNAATIKSIEKQIRGFGTLMQNASPEQYLGKRVRMSGYLKSKDVSSWCALWFRVDSVKKSLSFDNMYDRSLKGTNEWTYCELVLDVPKTADNLAYGALLDGTGQIWFDDLKFEIVSDSVPVTGTRKKTSPEKAPPRNLDFEGK